MIHALLNLLVIALTVFVLAFGCLAFTLILDVFLDEQPLQDDQEDTEE